MSFPLHITTDMIRHQAKTRCGAAGDFHSC